MAELGGEPEASVIGLETGLPAPNAAFANAMLCHGLDFDDTHSDSVAHIVDGGRAGRRSRVAEARGASGRELLTAVIAGNEIVTRIGMAASGAFHERGFHPTAVCGIFGATAAAARLGGLDRTPPTSALGIAGSMASGLFAYLDDGTPTKPIHPGWAAHGALLAARLAAHGAEGPPGVLEDLSASSTRSSTTRDRPRAAARRPRRAAGRRRGSVQAVPGLPLHPRLARRNRVPPRRLEPDEIEEVS